LLPLRTAVTRVRADLGPEPFGLWLVGEGVASGRSTVSPCGQVARAVAQDHRELAPLLDVAGVERPGDLQPGYRLDRGREVDD